ncbi:PTS-dependent dihydroxyacetone kinase phosphotransferase subunit DhaM [Pectinatus brassicae]|uniref:Dihydroxyacetone kinase DhaKLM complex PTS-EIIA-like component DhaM n=1 Tax=Pectinatus brassicae TaxID=862415 RepID=A0A840UJT2_9FIRM|nr:PTS mannose transporter subunit IID [Pectinatus brassicae]MBB5334948.1 dihydroxyacetone kinase DhaKLM complex PTS-EIIA-like component DhaM [Pectinatus brassicae]
MVEIVIISHSLKAAEGIRDIAKEMAIPGQVIEAVGGDKGKLGIDLDMVEETIEGLEKKDGVVIFVDLNSAIICAEMIKLKDNINNAKIFIADAPILEGTIVATVEASLGSSVEKVLKVAEQVKYLSKKNM